MHRTRSGVLVPLLAVVVALLPACSKHAQPSAKSVADDYVAAWNRGDHVAMASDSDHSATAIAALDKAIAAQLRVEKVQHSIGTVTVTKDHARASVTTRFTVANLGSFDTNGTLSLTHRSGRWMVEWSPQQIRVGLQPSDRFVTQLTWPARASILGAGGVSLTSGAPIVTVGIQGSRVKDRAQLTAVLTGAGAPANAVASALATAAAHPQWFVPVYEISEADYARLKPTIYPVPGTVFHSRVGRGAITTELAAHIVGTVGPITAELLTKLGPPYSATATVGRSGIEAAYERQLAGRPGGTIVLQSAKGAHLATLATVKPTPGTAVRTTIEPNVQRAAEQALDAVPGESALVAIRPSTGAVVATVSHPTARGFDIALDGQYPPGSTFKVVTSADLIEHGATPSTPATCPPTITVDGRVFHNFEGESAGPLTLEQAFAKSCNAAFIGLAQRLAYDSFAPTAAQFGLGARLHLGLDAFGGSVPNPVTQTDRAASAIGQAKILVSPLAMAAVAATVASGTYRSPRLVAGAPDDSVAPKPVATAVIAALRTMMAAVVANGTAANHGLPAGTFGKTGTAEFGTANPPATHAWFIGYRGDLAFAVLVPGGGVGGKVAAPIAAAFLAALAGVQ